MKNYSKYALDKLKEAQFKITKPREQIVHLLAKTNKALTPYEMRDNLKKQKIHADVVTIYRILETLEQLSLAHKVLAFSGYVRCDTQKSSSKNTKELCHHYLLCSRCHKVDEVEGEDLSNLENKITKDHAFSIQSHYLEFMGLCASCQKLKSK